MLLLLLLLRMVPGGDVEVVVVVADAAAVGVKVIVVGGVVDDVCVVIVVVEEVPGGDVVLCGGFQTCFICHVHKLLITLTPRIRKNSINYAKKVLLHRLFTNTILKTLRYSLLHYGSKLFTILGHKLGQIGIN